VVLRAPGRMGEDRYLFEIQAQSLPVDRGHHLGRPPRESPQGAVQRRSAPVLASKRERGVEGVVLAVQRAHMRHQLFGRRRQHKAIVEFHRHKRRDVHGLPAAVDVRLGPVLAAGRGKPIIAALAERAVYFRQDDLEPALLAEAIKERDRVEVVSQIPQVRQQEYGTRRQPDSLFLRVRLQSLAQRPGRVAEVVPLIEARPVEAVVARKPRDLHQLGDAVDVQKGHKQRIGELVPRGFEPAVPKRAGIDCGLHAVSSPLPASAPLAGRN